MEDLKVLQEKYYLSQVKKAMKIAVDRNVPTLSYTRGVLRNHKEKKGASAAMSEAESRLYYRRLGRELDGQ